MNRDTALKTTVQIVDTPILDALRLNTVVGMSWRKIACMPLYAGIPAGTLAAYCAGRPIVNPEHRAIMGLPVLIPTPACVKCGNVHTAKRCTNSPRKVKDLYGYKPNVLARMITERVEVK